MQKSVSFFKKQFQENWYILFIFIFAFILLFLIKSLWAYVGLPSSSELVAFFQNFLSEYGLIVVFLSALIESIILLGGYFPGTIIIFLSLSLTASSFLTTLETVIIATLGMTIGYSIDFLLGKFGIGRVLEKLKLEKDIEKLKLGIQKEGIISVFPLYILPSFGAIVSVVFGLIKYDYKKFLPFIIITIFIWNSLWGIVGFVFGDQVLKVITSGYIGLIIFSIWILFFVSSGKYKELKQSLK